MGLLHVRVTKDTKYYPILPTKTGAQNVPGSWPQPQARPGKSQYNHEPSMVNNTLTSTLAFGHIV